MERGSCSKNELVSAKSTALARRGDVPPAARPSFSRRAFLGFAAASAASLFVENFPGGARIAYADTTTAATTMYSGIQFMILNKYQLAITVFEASDGITPVVDANVYIYSLYTHKYQTATTDSHGVATFTIYNVSNNFIDEGDVMEVANTAKNSYTFYGQIVVWKDGYRDFETGQMGFTGGEATGLYLQKDDGKPYCRMISFDDWDIQYFQNEFVSHKLNTINHTLKVRIAQPTKVSDADSEIEVEYWTQDALTTYYMEDGTGTSTKRNTSTTDVTGYLSDRFGTCYAFGDLSFTHPYLNPDSTNKWYLGLGDNILHLHFWVDRSDRTLVDTKLCVVEGQFDEVCDGSSDDMIGFGYDNGSASLTLPKSIPLLGGMSISSWVPKLPVKIYIQPGYYFLISGGWTWETTKKTKPDGSGWTDWETTPTRTVKEQWQLVKEAMEATNKDYTDYDKNGGGAFGQMSSMHKIGWSLTLWLSLMGEWKKDGRAPNGHWVGEASISFTGAFSYTYAAQFVVGYVPVVVDFNFKVSVGIALAAMWRSPGKTKADLIRQSEFYASEGYIKIPFNVTVSVFAGVGLAYIATLGVRGGAAVAFTYGIYSDSAMSQLSTTKQYPTTHRIQVGVSISLKIEATIVIFTISLPIGSLDLYTYDSWDYTSLNSVAGASLQDAADSAVSNMLATMSVPELDEKLKPIPAASLLASAEFVAELTGGGASLLSLDGEDGSDEGVVGDYAFSYAPLQSGNGVQDVALGEPEATGAGAVLESIVDALDVFNLLDSNSTPDIQMSTDGLAPTTEVRIAKSVFSDAQVRVVSYNDAIYLLRIATVSFTIDGTPTPRTRLTIAKYDASSKTFGTPHVVIQSVTDLRTSDEGGGSYTDSDMDDYAFDVVIKNVRVSDADHGLTVVVARRPATTESLTQDEMLFSQASARSHLVYAAISDSTLATTESYLIAGDPTGERDPGLYLMPRMVQLASHRVTARAYGSCRVVAFKQCLVKGDDGSYTAGESYLETWLGPDDYGTYTASYNRDPIHYASSTLDACGKRAPFGIDSIDLLDVADNDPCWHALQYEGVPIAFTEFTTEKDAQGNQMRRLGFTYVFRNWRTALAQTYVNNVYYQDTDGQSFRGRVVEWPLVTDGYYTLNVTNRWLVCEGGVKDATTGQTTPTRLYAYSMIYAARWDDEDYIPQVECVDVGPFDKRFSARHFAVSSSGWTLYYATIAEEAAKATVDKDGTITEVPHGDPVYQIWAAPLLRETISNASTDSEEFIESVRTARFAEPYPLMKVSHPVDGLQSIDTGDSYSFVYTSGLWEKDDPDDSVNKALADLYYVSVPYVRGVSIEAANVKTPALRKGDKLEVLIDLYNGGNMVLTTSFDATLSIDEPAGVSLKDGTVNVNLINDYVPNVYDVPTKSQSDGELIDMGGTVLTEDNGYEYQINIKADHAGEKGIFWPGAHNRYLVEFDLTRWNGLPLEPRDENGDLYYSASIQVSAEKLQVYDKVRPWESGRATVLSAACEPFSLQFTPEATEVTPDDEDHEPSYTYDE